MVEEHFYIKDAPHEANDRIHSRTVMCNVIPESKKTIGNDVILIPGVNVEFVRGHFSTTDPQLVMRLNQRGNVLKGDDGYREWSNCYMTREEKGELERIRLQGELTRLQSEHNDLLSKVQEQKRQQAQR